MPGITLHAARCTASCADDGQPVGVPYAYPKPRAWRNPATCQHAMLQNMKFAGRCIVVVCAVCREVLQTGTACDYVAAFNPLDGTLVDLWCGTKFVRKYDPQKIHQVKLSMCYGTLDAEQRFDAVYAQLYPRGK